MADTVRPMFEYTVTFVEEYLRGMGYDMGCGSCPLIAPEGSLCWHYDISPQPLAEEQVGALFTQADVTTFEFPSRVDYIFSSHMVEDLGSKEEIVACLRRWSTFLKPKGFLVLLLPDMQGGRYPTVEEGGNCSHQTNVGRKFIEEVELELEDMWLLQVDTIPHEKCETIDAVFMKVGEHAA